jgi:enolase-phosphatase E1
VTIALRDRGVAAVLVDIEGTTTPLAFVHDTLFPFARAHMPGFLREQWDTPELRVVEAALEQEHARDVDAGSGPPSWNATRESTEAYALWLMDRDRKSPGLKTLQGWIWERGYRAGLLKSELYPDVAPAFRRWRAEGIETAIYSSGSALAQRLLFGNTPDGDLTPLLAGFFDTAVGAKQSPGSYARIASTLEREPAVIIFVSDVTAELRAAKTAGLQVVLSIRRGNPPQPDAETFEAIESFDELRT